MSVSSYDGSWPARYERESKRILAALGRLVLGIEHVGSTSIGGLAAKPTIDILVGARSLDFGEEAMARMADLGYEYRGEMGVPGRRYFRKGDRYPRDFNVQIVVWGEQLWNDYLAFRDYLRTHPKRAQEYAELKRQLLATSGGAAMSEYAAGKEPFIAETLRRARAWARPRGPAVREASTRDLARAGGQDAPIEIVEYDPAWPARFASERERLLPLLPGAQIHHIGSTAVPDMPAKPVIDLMALVQEFGPPIAALVEQGGYQYPEAFNAQLNHRRWLCRPTTSRRTHHLHLVDEQTELDRHLRFRDRLRASAMLRDEYARLKRELGERFGVDREAYSEAKSAFVRRVEADAQDEF